MYLVSVDPMDRSFMTILLLFFLGVLFCPRPRLLEGITEAEAIEAGKEDHFNPVQFYSLTSFLHGYETRFGMVNADGKTDCGYVYQLFS